VETEIVRPAKGDVAMTCGVCGWSITWFAYHLTFQRRQLNPGGAVASFAGYVQRWEQAMIPQAKMLAIDRVIHEFHYSLREVPEQPTRAAGVNLIEGKLTEVVRFLNELSGLPLQGEMRQTQREWEQKQGSIRWGEILERKTQQRKSARQ
jgi:hypothetical protein